MTIPPYRTRSQRVRVRRRRGAELAVPSSLTQFSFSWGTIVRTRRHCNMHVAQPDSCNRLACLACSLGLIQSFQCSIVCAIQPRRAPAKVSSVRPNFQLEFRLRILSCPFVQGVNFPQNVIFCLTPSSNLGNGATSCVV